MERDIRETPLYREIEEHFRRALGPAFGKLSGAERPEPSPDGRSIAFTGTRLDGLEGPPKTRVGLADVETGDVTEITHGPNSDRLPRWSPDGTRLVFLSDRAEEGQFQLYLLDASRVGEAASTPSVDGTVEYLEWSPDGTAILLGVAGRGADRAGGEGSGTTKEEQKGLPSWVPVVESGGEESDWRRLHVHDVATGTTTVASPEGLNVWEACWCGPDKVAAIVSDSPSEDAWYGAALVLLDLDTGSNRELYRTGRADRQIGWAACSREGRRVAVVQALSSDRGFLAGDVILIDPESGKPTTVETPDVDVSWLAWRDDQRLLFAGHRRLESVVGEVDAEGGAVTELWANHEAVGARQAQAIPLGRDSFAAVLESYTRPPEIAILRDGKLEAVSSFSHGGTEFLSDIGGRLERVTWTAPDGLEVDGLLAVPEGSGPHPLVLFVHGGPVSCFRDRWAMGYAFTPLLVSRGYAVLHANPRGSTGRGQEFADLVVGDMGGGDADDLLAGLDAMVERGVADEKRLGVTGGSYGGFMSAWLVTRTDRFAASVAMAPVTDYYSQHWTSNIGFWDRTFLGEDPGPGGPYHDRSPVMFAKRVQTPTLLTAGGVDKCTPAGQAIEFHQALREHGVESALVIYPEEGHGVRSYPAVIDLCTRMVEWFERHMPPR